MPLRLEETRGPADADPTLCGDGVRERYARLWRVRLGRWLARLGDRVTLAAGPEPSCRGFHGGRKPYFVNKPWEACYDKACRAYHSEGK